VSPCLCSIVIVVDYLVIDKTVEFLYFSIKSLKICFLIHMKILLLIIFNFISIGEQPFTCKHSSVDN